MVPAIFSSPFSQVHPLKKLILTNFQSPGDCVMLTAAVRDLHANFPGQFVTDVRTPYPELWDANPYLTDLDEDEPGVATIECVYPLIRESNRIPRHFLSGFTEFLGDYLGIRINPTRFQGDIHLTESELNEPQLPVEVKDLESDYWLVVSGGKFDYTIKWWDVDRYQRVADHFRGRIQFVQVGAQDHYHPRLKDVVDLVGKTDLRQLVNLVHHASGVLTPVSLLMHLAAAVPTRPGYPKQRACVVVAGGREPPQWEAYPSHQFLHTVGALSCCDQGGCWKSRTFPRTWLANRTVRGTIRRGRLAREPDSGVVDRERSARRDREPTACPAPPWRRWGGT